jgi:Ca-activated chloride channel family protein
VTFEIGDVPLTAVLLIDSSSSMAGGKLQAAIEGAVAFVENMRRLDQVKLMFFSDRLLSVSRLTSAAGVDIQRFVTTSAAGGTALYDHLFVALKQIEQRQGRRVIILLSDGVDSHSTLEMEAVAQVARRSQAQIHWIRMRRGSGSEEDDDRTKIWSSWRSAEENSDQLRLLKQTVLRSGGDTHFIASIDQIEGVFLDILRNLREQYVLGYYPTNRRNDGAWHDVQVKVKRPGATIRVAEGYIDF